MATVARLDNATPAHEYAEFFALHEGPPLWELSNRIKANGLREPIVLLDGKILDGRRRELACIRAKIKPTYREFGSKKTDGTDPLEFVIDINLHRRHLGEGERAIAAAKYKTAKSGRPAVTVVCQTPSIDGVSPEVSEIPVTNAQAAERFDTSPSSVDRASRVIANGTPALQAAVADDTLSVSDAARVAGEPAKVQNQAVQDVKDGNARTATAAVAQEREPGADDPESIEDEIKRINSLIESFCRRLSGMIDDIPADEWLEDMGRIDGAKQKIRDACGTLRTGKCTSACPACGGAKKTSGKKCGPCHGTGRMPKNNFDRAV